MHKLHELKEMLCDELEQYADKGELTAGTLDMVDKLSHAIKNIDKVIDRYEDEEGYSNRGYSRRYDMDGRSYARGRGRNAKRDSMGRYSRNYSYDSNMLVDELHELMESAPDEKTKQKMKRFISELETM